MKDYLPLNLQLFAEEGQQEQQTEQEQQTDKPLSFDDLLKSNKDYQAEFDRRVTKGLETAKTKWEEEANKRVEAAKTEAEKLAKMNAEQKAEHERQQREAALAEREKALNLRELRATAATTLAEKGLPQGLLDTLNYADAESCQKSIETMEAAFRQAVRDGVDERLKGKIPSKDGGGPPVTKPENMTYKERAELYGRDKQAYDRAFKK